MLNFFLKLKISTVTKLSEDVLYTNVFISTHLIYPHEHDEEKRKPPPHQPTNKQTNQKLGHI